MSRVTKAARLIDAGKYNEAIVVVNRDWSSYSPGDAAVARNLLKRASHLADSVDRYASTLKPTATRRWWQLWR